MNCIKNAFKKVSVALILLSILLTTLSGVTFAAETEVIDDIYKDAMYDLGSLGVLTGYEDGTMRFENLVTRAEYATMIVRLLGMESVADLCVADNKFADVSDDHWAKGYVSLLTGLDILNGYDETTFGPEDNVTFEQAVSIIVRVLGYEFVAAQNGGYPNGDLVVGGTLDLYDDIKVNANDEPATRGTVALLLFNALDVPMMVDKGYNGQEQYEVDDEKTLRTEHKLKRNRFSLSGRVTANSATSIYGSGALKENYVKIDDEIYHVGNTNAYDFLGQSVNFYIDDDEREKTIISIESDDNEFLTIASDEIVAVATDRITYCNNDGRKNDYADLTEEEQPVIIYNGKKISFSVERLKIGSGYLKLLDYNGDSVFDVIFIDEYLNYLAEGIDEENGFIILKSYNNQTPSRFNGLTYIDTNEFDTRLYLADETPAELKDIKEWDILSIAVSEDGETVRIYIIDKKIAGVVTEKYADENEYVINNNTYKIANSNGINMVELDLNEDGVFLLDKFDEIATAISEQTTKNSIEIQETENETTYAYILGVDSQPMVDEVRILLQFHNKDFKTENEIIEFDYPIYLNGFKTSADKAGELLTPDSPVVMTFEKNGRIASIDELSILVDSTNLKYTSSNHTLSNRLDINYVVDEDTILFVIDYDHRAETGVFDQLPLENGVNYYAKVYNGAYDKISEKVVVITRANAKVKPGKIDEANPAIVETVASVLEDGEERKKITLFKNGQSQTYICREESTVLGRVNALKKGDVILCSVNSENEIDSVEKIAELLSDKYYRIGTGGKRERVLGTLVSEESNADYSSTIIKVNLPSGDVSYEIGGKPIYVFNSKDNKVLNGTVDDFNTKSDERSDVFLYVVNMTVNAVVIVK